MKKKEPVEASIKELGHRFVKSFLDMLILQMVSSEATWGYDIIKKTKTQYNVKLRHGALYPMLNRLEAKGLLRSRKELQKGRVRKIYEISLEGKQLLNAYYEFLRAHTFTKSSES